MREANPYLKKLDTAKLIELGVELGLNRTELKRTAPAELSLELCEKWLREDDNVNQTPTWSSLATALRKIGVGGVAKIIEEEEMHQ